MSPKTLLSAVSRGFWPNDVEFCDASRPFPTKARGTAGRASFSAPTHAGPQGERSKKVRGGLFGPLQEVQKWHFSRVIGAQKRAPHRSKSHPRKRCAKNGPKEGSKTIIAHRFFGRKHFSHFFGHPVFRQKTKRPKTGPGRETRRNEAFSRFSLRGRTTKTRKNVQNEELRGSPKRIEKRDFLRFFRLTGRPERQNDTFFDSFRDLSKPPIFVAFRPPRFASGSLAALRGLPRSHVFDRFRAPSHSNRILYIYIFIYRVFGWIRNFSGRYGWIRNPFLLQVDDLGPKKHLFLQCFQ